MKCSPIKMIVPFLVSSLATVVFAQTSAKYELTITNGSLMPISPAAIYVKAGNESLAQVGGSTSIGLTALCQTGNAALRLNEIKADGATKSGQQTTAMIMPGESTVVEVEVLNPNEQSIQFEAMYGKSKDACAISSFSSHSLVALKQHVTSSVIQKDNAILSGAFTNPALPKGMTYLDPQFCANSTNAISCLRELSGPATGDAKIKFFAGYLPSLISALELKYGADDVQTLVFPTSGAVQLTLKLKH